MTPGVVWWGQAVPISVRAQIAFDLPRRDVTNVAVPLGAFGGQEVLEEMWAERVAHQITLLQFIERLTQIAGQLIDAEMPAFAMAHLVDVLVHRRSRIQRPLDAVKTGAQHRREGEIRVAGRIRHAKLDAGIDTAGCRNADQGTAIPL